MERTNGVISRACSRRSSCSCLCMAAGESSPPALFIAALSVAIGPVGAGTPLIVEQ